MAVQLAWLSAILKPVTELFGQWRSRKHELKLKKHELKVTEIETEGRIMVSKADSEIRMMEQHQTHEQTWETLSMANSGWKDEYITLLFTIPAVLIFIPDLQVYIESGFQRLESTPVWYQMVLLAIVGSALGVRIWDSFLKPLVARKKA